MSSTETEPQTEPVETPDEPVEVPSEPEAPGTPDVPVDDDPDQTESVAHVEHQGLSIEELEKVRTKLDTSANTWRRRVKELLGDEADMLVVCELCDPLLPGFHFPAEVMQPRDELHAHLLDVLRTPDSPDYNQAQHVRRCNLCDGWGVVLSGSRVAGKGQVKCQMCKGNGFVGDAVLPVEAQPQNGEVEVEFPEDTGPLVTEDTDVWGSPRILDDGQENPNYGKMPQYKDKSLP
jgi:hypothetical protein